MEQQHQSEVARILQQIESEYEAAHRGLHQFAIVGPHAFLTARTQRIAELHRQLQQQVGEQEAIKLLMTTPNHHNADTESSGHQEKRAC